jgi:hypothetical protein
MGATAKARGDSKAGEMEVRSTLTPDSASAEPTPLSMREGWLEPSGSGRGESPASSTIGLVLARALRVLFFGFSSRWLSVLFQPGKIVFSAAPWVVAVILFGDQPW